MLVNRQVLESREAELAPYAQRVSGSAGRAVPEVPHPLRTDYQRDRSRVIHSRAFRRLEYKTQVFLNGTGDHLRTRLTHTMEVASVSRTVATALGLNADLAEVIALAHDLGHAPFGHAGEDALGECMADHGGFEHNLQSLRTVRFIEKSHPDYDGLNLCHEALEGLRKHSEGFPRSAFGEVPAEEFPHPSIEAQVADHCDEIAYYSHDLEDGLSHHLLTPEQLLEVPLWCECMELSRATHPGAPDEDLLGLTIRNLIDREVDDLVHTTHSRLEEGGITSADEARRHPEPLACYSNEMAERNAELRTFLYANVYGHPEVAEANERGRERIRVVFAHLLDHPEEMGEITVDRIRSEGLERSVCDYVAGMTDRYLIQLREALRSSPHFS